MDATDQKTIFRLMICSRKVGRTESCPCRFASTLSWLCRWPLWHFHCRSGFFLLTRNNCVKVVAMMVVRLYLPSREMTLRLLKATWKTIQRILQTSENIILAQMCIDGTSPQLYKQAQCKMSNSNSRLDGDVTSQVESWPAMCRGEAFLSSSLWWKSRKKVESGLSNDEKIKVLTDVQMSALLSLTFATVVQGDGWAGMHQDQRQCL